MNTVQLLNENGFEFSSGWQAAQSSVLNFVESKNANCNHRAIKIEDNQRTHGREIWRKKCGQQVSGTAGGRWRRQHKTELDGDK